jgi:hypothetical protein
MSTQAPIIKPRKSAGTRRVDVAHVPTRKLSNAIREMRAGQFVEYASTDAIRADVEDCKRRKRK